MSMSEPYDGRLSDRPFGDADVCDISDACDRLDVAAVRTGAIRPVYQGCAPIIGTILTVTLVPGSGEPLGPLLEALTETTADAVLVDLAGRTDVQCWGTVLATAARLCGVRAAVVNGAVRDPGDLAGLGFPTYASGVFPATMHGRLVFAGAGHEVIISGQAVPSGWMVAADANGVLFFPPDRADEVVELARDIAKAEQEMLARARSAAETAGAAAALDILLDRPHGPTPDGPTPDSPTSDGR
jgi:regulator of RNase E activity RraA